VLIIGTELLQGKISDANTCWLGQFLRHYNLTISMALTVSDDPKAIEAALTHLYAHNSVVICSGGLGPTPDDITKEALANFFKCKVQASAEARLIAEKNYQRFDRELPTGHGYGFLPTHFVALNNPSGFAPGLWFSSPDRMLLAAPGVPHEFRDIVTEHFPLLIAPTLKQQDMQLVNFRTRGVPEEKIFKELCPGLWEKLSEYGPVSSLPHVMGVDVGITLQGNVALKEKAVKDLIYQSALAPYVWSEGFESLESTILTEARKRSLTVGFAESCTGGLCAHRLTNLSGSSSVFWGSIVSYDNSVKANLVGVKAQSLASFGAVSEIVAKEMAEGARERLGVDITVALTGIAGPGGGSIDKPVGTLWMAVASQHGVRTKKFQLKGNRENLKQRFSQVALYELLDEIRR
jgi:nicotinamide-nucleotide amidase